MNAETARRIENIVRFGTIAEVDHSARRAKVMSGGIMTDFLPWLTLRAGTTRTWSPPTIGEQCVILASSGELTTAVVLFGIYTEQNNSPSQNQDEHIIQFADSAQIKYNQSSGALTITGIKTARIEASGTIDIQCQAVNIKGNVNIDGSLSTTGTAQTDGNVSTNGTITAKGDITSGAISLRNHVHQEQGDGKDTGKAK